MEYIVIDAPRNGSGDEFTREFDNAEKAIEEATCQWYHLTTSERKKRTIYVLRSANPDEEADDHFDGDCMWLPEDEIVDEILDDIIHWLPDGMKSRINLYISDAVENKYPHFPEKYKEELIEKIETEYNALD